MAGTSMKTDVGTLRKASTDISTAVADLQASISRLQGQFADLRSVWIGAGSNQFGALAETYLDRNNKLQAVLDDISTAINQTATVQEMNENDVLSTVRTTAAALA